MTSTYTTSSGSTVGLTTNGFQIERQQDIILDLQTEWQAAFGQNVNLDPRSNNGQIISIMSERFALLWELLEAIYNSQYPSGAEGTSVDNILSLNGLTRQPATFGHTATAPLVLGTGITLFGLVCYGTPGTTVPKGSRIGDSQTPQNVFATDADILIAPAANAVQTVVLSGAPSSGSFALSIVDASANTLTTPAIAYSATAATVQAAITGLYDGQTKQFPYTDAVITQTGQAFVITFGGGTLTIGQPSCAATAQPLMLIAANSLRNGNTVVNLSVSDTVQGQPAQGVGSATAVATGPLSVLANTLTQILTPLTGWSGVVNQLDCITGTNVETDEEALLRRSTLLSAQAQGPLLAVLQNVLEVDGVTNALGFQNLTNAAQQLITFGATPSTGTYQLVANGGVTSPIAYSASYQSVQASLQAIPGLSSAQVTGNAAYGYTVDFNGSNGGQAVALIQVVNNTTGVPIQVAFGRPPKSVEVVVQGGQNVDIAKAIYAEGLAGLSTYAAPVAQTTGNVVAGSATLSVLSSTGITVGLSLLGFGINPGTLVSAISGNTITMSQVALASYANTPITLSNATLIADSNKNPIIVGFSRPQLLPIYIVVNLTTDLYNVPGQPSSGFNSNAKFNPASVPQLQQDLVSIGNAVPVGGRVVGFGSQGLVGSFNEIPGLVAYDLFFGTSPNPTSNSTIQLLSEQAPYCSAQNVVVSYQ